MNYTKQIVVMALVVSAASASSFSTLGTKWDIGPNNAQLLAGNEGTAGHATWSIMGPGIAGHSSVTLDFGALTTSSEVAMVAAAFASWSAVANITFTMVSDSGADTGASNADGGHIGDIRFASFNTGFGSNVIAHAYQPGSETSFGASWNVGGDTHFNADFTFVDDPNATSAIDFQTVALHEIGHALGLGHSSVSGSIMEPVYAGARRSLIADDIAGIQHIYGRSVVPEPGSLLGLGLGLAVVVRMRRRR